MIYTHDLTRHMPSSLVNLDSFEAFFLRIISSSSQWELVIVALLQILIRATRLTLNINISQASVQNSVRLTINNKKNTKKFDQNSFSVEINNQQMKIQTEVN